MTALRQAEGVLEDGVLGANTTGGDCSDEGYAESRGDAIRRV